MSATADPEKSLVPELGILGVEIDQRIAARRDGTPRPVRHHRRRARGGRDERGAASAEGHHPQPEQPADRDAAGAQGRVRALKPGAPVTLQIQRTGG